MEGRSSVLRLILSHEQRCFKDHFYASMFNGLAFQTQDDDDKKG
jgi:hypothetical protein